MNILDKSRGQLPPAEHIQADPAPSRWIIGALKDWRGLLGFACGAAVVLALWVVTP